MEIETCTQYYLRTTRLFSQRTKKMRKLMEQYEKWRFEINVEKTKNMSIGKEVNVLATEEGVIKTTLEYKYLGVQIPENGRNKEDILTL